MIFIDQIKLKHDWLKWQAAIEAKHLFLQKYQIFGSISTNLTKPPIGHKLIFTRKINAYGRTICYKVRLVAHSYFQ